MNMPLVPPTQSLEIVCKPKVSTVPIQALTFYLYTVKGAYASQYSIGFDIMGIESPKWYGQLK
jgi:hypothetical protein